MDLRRAAMASFAVIAVGAGAVWYRSTKALSKKDTTAPSVAKKTLIAVLEDLHAAAEDASAALMVKARECDGPAARKHVMDTASKIFADAMAGPLEKTLKAHGVVLDEVKEAYHHYENRGDDDVLEAAQPIKSKLGPFMLDRSTCLQLLQAISDAQCENMNAAVKAAAATVKPTPSTMQQFMDQLRQRLASHAEGAARRKMGISAQQLMMKVQEYCQGDPNFQKAVQATMAPVDACSQQALNSLAVQ